MDPLDIQHEYAYRTKWTTIFWATLLFGAGGIFMGYSALTNEQGLIINHNFELSPNGATWFYWILTGSFSCFVAVAGFTLVARITLAHRVAYNETCLFVPRSHWSNDEICIPFNQISQLTPSVMYGQSLLKIVHDGGTSTLADSMFPTKDNFQECCAVIVQRSHVRQA
jgi:hypothetical protein